MNRYSFNKMIEERGVSGGRGGIENFIVKKSLRPVPSQGMVVLHMQAQKHGSFRLQRGYPGKETRGVVFFF